MTPHLIHPIATLVIPPKDRLGWAGAVLLRWGSLGEGVVGGGGLCDRCAQTGGVGGREGVGGKVQLRQAVRLKDKQVSTE